MRPCWLRAVKPFDANNPSLRPKYAVEGETAFLAHFLLRLKEKTVRQPMKIMLTVWDGPDMAAVESCLWRHLVSAARELSAPGD